MSWFDDITTGKPHEDYKKRLEAEMQWQGAVVERIDNVCRAINVLIKSGR